MRTVNLKIILIVLFVFITITATTQTAKKGKKISTDLFGLFFEDINYAADGGLYAELVQNRSFEYNPTEQRTWHPLSFWEYITPGFSYGKISVETISPVHPNNPHYIVLEIEHVGNEPKYKGRDKGVGIKNIGFEGIVIRKGEKYNLSFFAQQLSNTSIELEVSLQNPKGEILAQSSVSTSSKDWKKYTTALTATASNDSVSLVILAKSIGKLALDVISLFPEKTFKNRPNGLRVDIAEMLAEMQPKFIRFPGGCLVHGDGLENMYRWKNTIGPIEQRVEQKNIWGYHQTMGLGYYEYFQFCEDIGAKPVPVVPAAVSCQNSGGTWKTGGTGQRALPKEEMPEYIQEVLDLIEWANGAATSTWGAKRAAAGHPEPFNLEYIGIGNEDKITSDFEERFVMINKAVKEKYPEITVIGTVGPFHSGDDYDKGWELANSLNLPMVDEHYYEQPEWFKENLYRYDGYSRKEAKVYLGEYASWGNKHKNAVAEAAYMISLERNADVVEMASYAPLLAKKGFTQWKTDMVFFDNTSICFTPNYYVQKMFMTNQGDFYFDNIIKKEKNNLDLAASCVTDSKTGDIILKMVNTGTQPKTMKINLTSLRKEIVEAEKTVLMGDGETENTLESPQNITPTTTIIKVDSKFEYTTPAMSLTVIRIKTKK